MQQVGAGTVIGRYRIEGIVGRGGMGVVYLATHLALDAPVALKVVAPELAADEEFRERFKHESRVAASVRHPNVIRVYDAGEEDGVLYLAMEYVEGTELKSALSGRVGLDAERAVRIVSQIASALDAAHARGLVHRDVKPGNVLLARGSDGLEQAYLTDFGLTKQLSDTGYTRPGQWVGTLDYAAPEQISGAVVDARTDVYALGCVAYHALTGQVPFPAEGEPAKLWAHLNWPRPSLETLRPDLPSDLGLAVRRAMAVDPAERFDSAGDFASAARAALHREQAPALQGSVATGDASAHGERTVLDEPTVLDPPPAPPPPGAQGPATPPTQPVRPPQRGMPLGARIALAVIGAAVIAAAVLAGTGVLSSDDDGGQSRASSSDSGEESGPTSDSPPALTDDEVKDAINVYRDAFAREDRVALDALAGDADYLYYNEYSNSAMDEYRELFRTLKVRDYSANLVSLEVNGDVARARLKYRYKDGSFPMQGLTSIEFRREQSGRVVIGSIRSSPDLVVVVDVHPEAVLPVDAQWTCRLRGEVVARRDLTITRTGDVHTALGVNADGRRAIQAGDKFRCSYSDVSADGTPSRFTDSYFTPYGG